MRITTNNGTTISGSLGEVLATLSHLGVKAEDVKPVTSAEVTETAVTPPFEVVEAELAKLHADKAGTPEATPVPVPKPARDSVIKMAIADVESLLSRNHTDSPWRDAESNQIASNLRRDLWFSTENQGYIVTHAVDFVINADKRTVVAIVGYKNHREEISKGRAKCAPGDVFNEHIGKAIALRRALGLAVPVEYFEAGTRGSDDLAVGDVVRGKFSGTHKEIVKFASNNTSLPGPAFTTKGNTLRDVASQVTLINDSARHTAPELEVSRIIRH